jgi:DNA-binding response OmpR family regulator
MMQETGENRKILIVEDEADIRQVLSFFLKQAGFEVQAVSGGQEAIDMLPTYQPHLVILDILMRPVSGWQVLQWIRTTHDDSTIPVLILTALVQFSEQMQGLERGAVDYVTKPMQPRRVVERVKRLLDMSVEQRLLLRQVYMNERRQILDQLAAAQADEF